MRFSTFAVIFITSTKMDRALHVAAIDSSYHQIQQKDEGYDVFAAQYYVQGTKSTKGGSGKGYTHPTVSVSPTSLSNAVIKGSKSTKGDSGKGFTHPTVS